MIYKCLVASSQKYVEVHEFPREQEEEVRVLHLLHKRASPFHQRSIEVIKHIGSPKIYLVLEFVSGCSLLDFVEQHFGPSKMLTKLLDCNQLHQYLVANENDPNLQYNYHQLMSKQFGTAQQHITLAEPYVNDAKNVVSYPQAVMRIFSQLVELVRSYHSRGEFCTAITIDNCFVDHQLNVKKMACYPFDLFPDARFPFEDYKTTQRAPSYKRNIFQLGVVLYILLTGQRPWLETPNISFACQQRKHLAYVCPTLINKDASPFCHLLDIMLDPAPENRVDVFALREELNKLINPRFDADTTRRLKILCIGNLGIGKTTLIQKFAQQQDAPRKITRRIYNQANKLQEYDTAKQLELEFFDPAGAEQNPATLPLYLLLSVDLCLIMYAPHKETTASAVEQWETIVHQYSPTARVVVMENDFGFKREVQPLDDAFCISAAKDVEPILFKLLDDLVRERRATAEAIVE